MADIKRIRVEMLARVEGEGALEVDIAGGTVQSVRLSIFEPPRLFEAFLRGRAATEAPDIAARICGICPVAYQMSASHAIEAAFGMQPGPEIRALRRLLYCGEYIESHALHMVMLHAPDFLGFEDGIAMAAVHGDLVKRALAAKKAGNALMRVLGGREIHPINVRIGGFYRLPSRAELAALQPDLAQARDDAVAILRWATGFEFPDVERDWELVALRHPDEYPLNEGRIASTGGIDIAFDEFETVFEERHIAHSNALHAVVRARGAYLTGPLARYALNFDRLPAHIQALAREAGLGPVCRNPYRSILVRAVETVYACEEAMRLIAAYTPPSTAAVALTPRAGSGAWATEAPRGLLWHRYELDADGTIRTARIVPPTAQNQPAIEADLLDVASRHVDYPDAALQLACEAAVRNHDPCISCATHFLKLAVNRRG
jgi:coenzyme F420-reducing hydrogenase alpha subunit